jgi:hypothetical protein
LQAGPALALAARKRLSKQAKMSRSEARFIVGSNT